MLSDFSSSQNWLNQFTGSDKKIAIELLDNLVFISTSRFTQEIDNLLSLELNDTESVVMIPVRELNVGEIYFPPNNDNHSPELLIGDTLPGSEAIIANLITQISRKYRGKLINSDGNRAPSLSRMREKKVRKIIMIDDLIGSGKRVSDFINSITQNKTIRSWVSGNLVKLVVVSYYVTDLAKSRLKMKTKVEYKFISKYPTFKDLDKGLMVDIEKLSNKYSHKTESFSLGFGRVFGRAIFEHSVPNNTPAILWRNQTAWKAKGFLNTSKSWDALFPNRAVPFELKLEKRYSRTGSSSIRELNHLLLMILDSNPSVKSFLELSKVMKKPLSEVSSSVSRLLKYDLLDIDLNLTERGKSELKYLMRNTQKLESNPSYYYPYR